MQGIASCNRVWGVRMVSHAHFNLELYPSHLDVLPNSKISRADIPGQGIVPCYEHCSYTRCSAIWPSQHQQYEACPANYHSHWSLKGVDSNHCSMRMSACRRVSYISTWILAAESRKRKQPCYYRMTSYAPASTDACSSSHPEPNHMQGHRGLLH